MDYHDLINKITLADCMDIMREMPDKCIDLAIVDPPYGIGVDKMTLGNGRMKIKRGCEEWDSQPPPREYFLELFRTSQHQIIWGANNMVENLYNRSAWVFWDKGTGNNDFSDGELAWTSFDGALRKFFKSWVGANAKNESNRIHPTEKPVALYRWLLQNYAKPGQLILDTHSGSGSCAVACHIEKYDFIAIEKDADYHRDSVARLDDIRAQGVLF